jgi:hypothetical protein
MVNPPLRSRDNLSQDGGQMENKPERQPESSDAGEAAS